jgi:hypothetical protein
MSAGTQLSRWARDRERQRGERPRRYWSRQRGVRHALEQAARDEQLELDLSRRGGGSVPVPPIQVADLPPRTNSRPTVAD